MATSLPLKDATNSSVPATPPSQRIKALLDGLSATPRTPVVKRLGTPGGVSAGSSLVLSSSMPTSTEPHSSPRHRVRAYSLPQPSAIASDLHQMDHESLVQEVLSREASLVNLREDVEEWSARWQACKAEGQQLYVEAINHTMRSKRYAEALTAQNKELNAMKQRQEADNTTILGLQGEILMLKETNASLLEQTASQPASYSNARESALISQTLSLQSRLDDTLGNVERLQRADEEKSRIIARLERQLIDERAKMQEQAPAFHDGVSGSPLRKMEALSIRTEALRARNAELEARMVEESSARTRAERESRDLRVQLSQKEEELASIRKKSAADLERAEQEALTRIAAIEEAHSRSDATLLGKIGRLEATLKEQAQRLADGMAMRSGLSEEAQSLSVRVVALEASERALNETIQEREAANAALESDIRLLYQKHRHELQELDRKYHRQDYKTRYHRALRQCSQLERKIGMLISALESIPAISASSHILAGLLSAGVDGLSAQYSMLRKRLASTRAHEQNVNERETTVLSLASAQDEQMRIRIAELEASEQSLRVEVENMRLDLESARVVRSALAASQESAYKEEICSLTNKQTQYVNAIQTLRGQMEKLETTLHERESALAEMEFIQAEAEEKHTEELESQKRSQRASLESMDAALRDRQELVALVEAQSVAMVELQHQASLSTGRLQLLLAERDSFIQAFAATRQHGQDVASAWQGCRRVLRHEKDRRITSTRGLKQQLQELSEKYNVATSELERSLSQSESTIQRLADELSETHCSSTNKLEAMQAKLDAATAAVGGDLWQARERVRELEQRHLDSTTQWSAERLRLESLLSEQRVTCSAAEEEVTRLGSRLDELVRAYEGAQREWQVQRAEINQELLHAQELAREPRIPMNKSASAIMHDFSRRLAELTQKTDERVAIERAKIVTLETELNNIREQKESNTQCQCESLRKELSQEQHKLDYSRLLELQLLKQLEAILLVHQHTVQLMTRALPNDQRSLLQEASAQKEELLRLQREILSCRHQWEVAARHEAELTRDRDALRQQLVELQMELQERVTKAGDDDWKVFTRQVRSLWLKYEKQLQKEQADA